MQKATVKVVPVTSFTFCRSLAPQACPIRTVAPDASPMTKEMRKIMIGKNTDTAASASYPDQLADIDVVDGARQRLQDVADGQRHEKDKEAPPERLAEIDHDKLRNP